MADTGNNHDPEAQLLARAYKLILSWPDDPTGLGQAAGQAAELAFEAREADEAGDGDRARKLRKAHDDLWDRIEGALDAGQDGH